MLRDTTVARPDARATSGRELRILVLTNMYPTVAEPGFGCFVRDQVDDLNALGVTTSVLAFDGRQKRRRYLQATRDVRAALRRDRYDVVHAHYGLSGAVAALQTTAPVVTTFHGSDVWIPWQRRVSSLVARRTQPIAVAPVVAANLGVCDAAVIPCAVDLERFAPIDRAAARRALGWPEAPPCVLFPAARADRAKVDNKRPGLFDAMVERLRPIVPATFATSLDGLSRPQVALAMNAADVVVMTSVREGAPIVVKEALACETPVVSVSVGDVPAVIDGLPGCAVVSAEPAAMAQAVYGALDLGRDARLRESVRSYGRRLTAERVVAVYRCLLDRSPA